MTIIFDLDYTLMDTLKLHNKLAEIFGKENYRADYQMFFKDKGISFDGEKYLEILKTSGRIDKAREDDLRLKLAELMENMDKYLKPEAFEVLEYFKQAGNKLVLITFGNKKWQEEKVKNLGIKKYFDNIVFEEQEKSQSEYLKSLGESGETVRIINDNLREAEKMRKVLGENVELSLIKREDGKNKDGIKLYELIPEENRGQQKETKELNLR